jgi:murein DD-endopeptidase MepM/ murein hydrolase activator NlpD
MSSTAHPKIRPNPYRRLAAWLSILWLAGCQLPGALAPQVPPTQTSEAAEMPQTTEATILQEPTPTAVIALDDSVQTNPGVLALSLPTPAPDPLRFSFPTPGQPPVSAWRPPLYPTPWVPTPYDHFYFSRPIAADEVNWPLADYRYGGVFLPNVVHTGIDIPAPLGTPVLAAGPGRVTWAGYGLFGGVEDITDPYGMAVGIKHNFGYNGQTLYTVYGHLSRVDVLVGQQVDTGDVLGLVGETGNVTGPHLHFEVRVGQNNFFQTRNPELWLAPPEGWGILAARLLNSNGGLITSLLISVHSKSTPQSWVVKSYGGGAAISDDYYQENLVMGDLPGGDYVVWIPFEGATYNVDVHITPGMVTFIRFHGKDGANVALPPTPRPDFTPPAPKISPTP